jgi:hypothetical protein
MSEFAKLLSDIGNLQSEPLNKSDPAGGDEKKDPKDEPKVGGTGNSADEELKKSVGEHGDQFLKALDEKLGGFMSEEMMNKALVVIADVLRGQGDLIKSQQEKIGEQNATLTQLSEKLKEVSAEGKGRKAVVSVANKPSPLQKSEPEDGMDAREFMAKCMEASKAGKITALDVSIAENYVGKGIPVPESIVKRVIETR